MRLKYEPSSGPLHISVGVDRLEVGLHARIRRKRRRRARLFYARTFYFAPGSFTLYQGVLICTREFYFVPGSVTLYQGVLLCTRECYFVPGSFNLYQDD